jgi:hypothetical protein
MKDKKKSKQIIKNPSNYSSLDIDKSVFHDAVLGGLMKLARNGNQDARFKIYRFLLAKGLVRRFHAKYGHFTD